jgi:hypothetical protein
MDGLGELTRFAPIGVGSMQCKDFEAVLQQEGLAPLPLAARSHLAECLACQNFLADLSVIVSSAKQIPAEIDPPERLWVSLRAQMEAEGVIKPPATAAAEKVPWWGNLSTLLKPRVLVAGGATLALVLAAFLTVHKSPTKRSQTMELGAPVARSQTPVPPKSAAADSQAASVSATVPQRILAAKPATKPAPSPTASFKPSPSDTLYESTPVALQDAERGLSGTPLRGSVEADASLRENLRVINGVIAECQKHLKKYPNDALAREYLASAYQQKAELLAALLDSGRSEQ